MTNGIANLKVIKDIDKKYNGKKFKFYKMVKYGLLAVGLTSAMSFGVRGNDLNASSAANKEEIIENENNNYNLKNVSFGYEVNTVAVMQDTITTGVYESGYNGYYSLGENQSDLENTIDEMSDDVMSVYIGFNGDDFDRGVIKSLNLKLNGDDIVKNIEENINALMDCEYSNQADFDNMVEYYKSLCKHKATDTFLDTVKEAVDSLYAGDSTKFIKLMDEFAIDGKYRDSVKNVAQLWYMNLLENTSIMNLNKEVRNHYQNDKVFTGKSLKDDQTIEKYFYEEKSNCIQSITDANYVRSFNSTTVSGLYSDNEKRVDSSIEGVKAYSNVSEYQTIKNKTAKSALKKLSLDSEENKQADENYKRLHPYELKNVLVGKNSKDTVITSRGYSGTSIKKNNTSTSSFITTITNDKGEKIKAQLVVEKNGEVTNKSYQDGAAACYNLYKQLLDQGRGDEFFIGNYRNAYGENASEEYIRGYQETFDDYLRQYTIYNKVIDTNITPVFGTDEVIESIEKVEIIYYDENGNIIKKIENPTEGQIKDFEETLKTPDVVVETSKTDSDGNQDKTVINNPTEDVIKDTISEIENKTESKDETSNKTETNESTESNKTESVKTDEIDNIVPEIPGETVIEVTDGEEEIVNENVSESDESQVEYDRSDSGYEYQDEEVVKQAEESIAIKQSQQEQYAKLQKELAQLQKDNEMLDQEIAASGLSR